MKKNLNKYLIVVEGKTDIDFLSSFIDSNFYSVNGSAVNNKDINFIKNSYDKGLSIIILTDPDYPGGKIRNYINSSNIPCYNAYVRKEFSIKHGKVGVAESTKNEVLDALNNLKCYENNTEINKENITINDLIKLDLVGKNNSNYLRNKVAEYLHIGHCNSKQFIKRTNMLNMKLDDIKEALKNVR